MGRRSSHSPEELRRLILQSTRGTVEKSGIKALSARAIANDIGYSPGTLYNVFQNLDELLLTIQVTLLDELLAELKAIPVSVRAEARLKALSNCYISYALRNKQLWNLFGQHTSKRGKQPLSPVDEKFNAIIALMAEAIQPSMRGACDQEIRQFAQAMWASIHGISEIAVAEKISTMTTAATEQCVSTVVDCFSSKLQQRCS